MSASRPLGFSLIEVLIAMAIAVILLILAAPGYAVWLADSQIRNGAQALASGLRYAQAEAIKRNVPIQVVVDPTTKTGSWSAQLGDVTATVLQVGVWEEGADKVVFGLLPAGRTTVTFTGLGQIGPNFDATLPFNWVDVSSTVPGTRALRVLVGGNRTGIKICDPLLTWPDPKGCPP